MANSNKPKTNNKYSKATQQDGSSGYSGSRPLERKMSTGKKIFVSVVCFLLAVMMMVPSLIMLFGNGAVSSAAASSTSSSTSEATSSTSASSTSSTSASSTSSTSASSTSSTTGSSTSSTTGSSTDTAVAAANVNTEYQVKVDEIKKEIEANPTDNTYNKSLAYTYFQWGSALVDAGETEANNTDLVDVWKNAAQYYTTYLQTDESGEAEVNRALATYYGGDLSKAIRELEAYTQTDDGAQSASAWANLGVLYQAASRSNDAKTAYNKALEVDPDDAAGVKSFISTQLNNL